MKISTLVLIYAFIASIPAHLWPSLSIHRLLRAYRLRADFALCSFDSHWPCRCQPDCGGPVEDTAQANHQKSKGSSLTRQSAQDILQVNNPYVYRVFV